jgi:hypothetical protein
MQEADGLLAKILDRRSGFNRSSPSPQTYSAFPGMLTSAPDPATSGNGLLRNASECSETFRNTLARMIHCLGHPAIVASNGPVGDHYPFC